MALHHSTRNAAVKKYSEIKGTEEEVKAAIAADEKQFTPEQVEEIYAAILDAENTPPPPPPAPEPEPEVYGAKKHYEEWEVKIEGGQAKKLVISRQRVMITDEQAEVLNQGVLEGGNTYGKMYFLKK